MVDQIRFQLGHTQPTPVRSVKLRHSDLYYNSALRGIIIVARIRDNKASVQRKVHKL